MRIETALERYLLQLEADGRSPHTIGQYRRHVLLLARWARQEGLSGKVGDLDHQDIARFLVSPEARTRPDGRPKKATSTNALRSTLRTFFSYLHEAGYSPSNAARLVRRARCSPPPPRALSPDEQKRLLKVLAAGKGYEAQRDFALFDLLLSTGLRVGSAVALDVDDVDLDRGALTVRYTKYNRPDRIILGKRIGKHLARFISNRDSGPLFADRRGRRITTRHVNRRLKQWLKMADIDCAASPHTLRHSFATDLYRRTQDILLVREALRHRSLTSTTVYASVSAERMLAALSA